VNIFNSPEQVAELTRLWQGDRLPDGRPDIPANLLERLQHITSEEAWSVLDKEKYVWQFEGNWMNTHPSRILVGRVVTCQMMPSRPDLNSLVQEAGEREGRIGGQNSWVIDTLQPNDVLVVDLFGKVREGTFVGDNLGTSVMTRTKAGAVIDGGIRDYQGLVELENVAFFVRGVDPTPIRNTTMVSVNMPIRIGQVTVLPGDVVLGTPTGVTFIPSHLVQRIVETGENINLRDTFGKMRLNEKKYTPGEIDTEIWAEHIQQDYQQWLAARNK
jgi:4-hydroxy-4-methyl-2-oxoglutarate aldolase